jgi:hypothetical protein
MSLRPGDLLGLPAPDLIHHVALFRYLMVALALAWALVILRAHPRMAVLFGLLYSAVAVGFWTLALGRPYGLFIDSTTTRRVAECAVGAAGGGWEGVLSGQPGSGVGAVLARWGVAPGTMMFAPALLAPLAVPVVGALLYFFWTRRDRAWTAALLWLAFATGDLDGLRGVGVVPGAWGHPLGVLGLLASVVGLILFARLPRRWLPVGLLLAAAWLGAGVWWSRLGEPVSGLGLLRRVFVATLDQGLWLPLGWYGLMRRGEAASRALVMAGLVLLVPWPDPLRVEPWGAHALYRLGLVMAAAGPVAEVAAAVGTAIRQRYEPLAAVAEVRLGMAALVAVLAPGSFLVWWDPVQLDPLMAESLPPVPGVLVEVAAAVRHHTGADSVVMAGTENAPLMAALAGRRVLRAPFLAVPPDGDARWLVEEKVLAGRTDDRLVRRYGVSHVLVAPGDFVDRGLERPEDLETIAPVTLLYRHPEGYRLYALRAPFR